MHSRGRQQLLVTPAQIRLTKEWNVADVYGIGTMTFRHEGLSSEITIFIPLFCPLGLTSRSHRSETWKFVGIAEQ